MAAAVTLAMEQLRFGLNSAAGAIHIIGYSTGASLALDYTLNALEGHIETVPASLVLISPAIRIHAAAKFAGFKNALSVVPGLGGLAWLGVMEEFDPYKYNSFATNAGAQVHQLTVDVDRRLQALEGNPAVADRFPPVLVFKSAVDSTVTTGAVVDNLLARLPADRNELVLFDINRHAAVKSTLLVSDPAPFTDRLMAESDLPFAVTIITNESAESVAVVAWRKAPHELETSLLGPLGLAWPGDVVSLSHVALPISPNDPLYGRFRPLESNHIFLGNLAIKGERGLLKIPEGWLLRMRNNPFYSYLEDSVLGWLEEGSKKSRD
jgi:pimeloyl-ACP methyl ester carboxylesterase